MNPTGQESVGARTAQQTRPSFSPLTKSYLACVIGLGYACGTEALAGLTTQDPVRFGAYLLIAVAASLLKVRLPGIHGTMSVNFFFFLVAILSLTRNEALTIGLISALAQSICRTRTRPKVVQTVFNLSLIVVALRVAYDLCHSFPGSGSNFEFPVKLVLMATAYFVMNTLPVAIIIRLTEKKPLLKTWKDTYFWAFTYYLVGAIFAAVFQEIANYRGWYTATMILPVVYAVYRSYSFYIRNLEAEKQQAESERQHAEEVSGLHLRTIQALALAIEAKDETTRDHLQRVQVYSVELASALGLPEIEIRAIRAASVLHDIGKLAVPEHIISKPGKLTFEEFEKMKIHPVVGAEILEHVQFPYPVVPIVRHHHEKWDGSGYPDGLKGEEIPLGARILSAVDCLDALASQRQYRRGLPLDQAMAEVAKLSGATYDPRIVEILQQNYEAWEQKTHEVHGDRQRLSLQTPVSRGEPAAGYDPTSIRVCRVQSVEFLDSIGAARHEAQILYEMTQDMMSYLALDEMLSVVATRLRKLVPHDTFVLYLAQDGVLAPEFVSGEEARLFSSLRIPLGSGISGWVAEARTPIVNGNPSVEPGYLNDRAKFSVQRSIVSVPLEIGSTVLGALTLVDSRKEAFTQDHLRVLLLIASKLSQSIQNSLRYRFAKDTSMTDYLTGLPNARSLFSRLSEELRLRDGDRSRVSVLVCDLDGFKTINDRLGHLTGNRVLQQVALALRDGCRPHDYVARMGGDEFVLIVRHTHPAADGLIRRLATSIEEIGRAICPDSRLSASIGYAVAPDDGLDPEALLACADTRMYAVKETKRASTVRERFSHDGASIGRLAAVVH